jgi:sulfopyruvate decarboxylase subunit alpha
MRSITVAGDAIAAQRVPAVYVQIVETLKDIGVTLTAGLPDDWVAPFLDVLDDEPGIVNVRVAREPEVVGICTGGFFGGVKTAGIMGATGFLTCISELATINLKYQIPLFVIVSLRGSIDDHQAFQEVQGRVLTRQFEALGLPYLQLDEPEKIKAIPDAFVHSRLQKRPYVVGLSKALLNWGS